LMGQGMNFVSDCLSGGVIQAYGWVA